MLYYIEINYNILKGVVKEKFIIPTIPTERPVFPFFPRPGKGVGERALPWDRGAWRRVSREGDNEREAGVRVGHGRCPGAGTRRG